MTETIKDVLERLSTSINSTTDDDESMEYICHRIGFKNARVITGIVYLKGHGAFEVPPADVHLIAKTILQIFQKE